MATLTNRGTGGSFEITQEVVAPNRQYSAYKFSRGTAAARVEVEPDGSIERLVDHTFSIFAKADSHSNVSIRVGESIDVNFYDVTFDLSDNSVETEVSVGSDIQNLNPSIQAIGDGWYSLQLGFQMLNSLVPVISWSCIDNSEGINGEAEESGDFYFWNPVLERRSINVTPSYLGSALDNKVSILEDEFYYVQVFTAETESIEYTRSNGSVATIDVSIDSEDFDTDQAVRYYRIPQSVSDGYPKSVTLNSNRNTSRTINIEREARFDKRKPAICTFINKNGVLEDFWMSRKAVERLSVKQDFYYKNLYDGADFSYNVYDGANQAFNTIGRTSWTFNTAIKPESENNLIQEMRMSEDRWITFDGQTFKAVLKSMSDPYKTHVNDKLVHYTLVFEVANRLDNTIQ